MTACYNDALEVTFERLKLWRFASNRLQQYCTTDIPDRIWHFSHILLFYCFQHIRKDTSEQKSRSPSPPVSQRRTPQARSTSIESPQKRSPIDLLEITVNSVMEDVQESKVIVAASCKVYELKNSICQATDVLAEKQLLIYKSKELKASNAVLYVPPSFPEGSVDELRSKIKSLTNIRGSSAENIPRNLSKESLEKPSFEKKSDPYTVTELQLKTFFEPPETLAQMEREMKDLTLPPSNMEELIAVKTKREETLKTTCGVCRRKLHVTEQQMACACSYTFCKKHREPDKHFCNIDHRHAGRSKIHKENPKVSGGGLHKARTPSKG
ncbi:AN1-like Zinc finger [Necator americanus]|uniref:AN1-like Zinc finger n=1 Tax=Necator americanus TaxID=51031 RepID=W2T3A2_NECAM|nr:AN1-like Zinc finger [Necator americanus]ETN76039.1 AN1-like Zinc finger [Necator americanus]